jgi:dTDP-4-dehydrorhamnose 3,5-epimerase
MRSLAVPLSGARQESFWVPEGFAHGFLSLTDDTLVSYKVTNFWHKESERSLSMRVLPIEEYIDTSLLIVSEKDLEAPLQLS